MKQHSFLTFFNFFGLFVFQFSKPTPDQAFSPSSVTSNLTLSLDVTAEEDHKPVLVSSTHGGSGEVREAKISSLEAELVVNCLRKVTTEVLSLSEVDPQSKKLLHALLEMVIKMLQTVPEQKDRTNELLLAKTQIIFTCLLFILAMVIGFYFVSGPRSSFGKPPPT